MKKLLVSSAVFLSMTTIGLAAPISTVTTEIGGVLAGSENGMSLYTFTNDENGVSNCYERCAWRPDFGKSIWRSD